MLSKIDNCESFGSIEIIAKLIRNCKREKIRISDILEFFRGESYSEVFYTEDILKLLIFLDIIRINKDFITITKIGEKLSCDTEEEFKDNFKVLLASKIFDNNFIDDFLSIENISYDVHGDRYLIKSSKILMKYFALRNLLIKLRILERIKDTSLIIVNQPILKLLKERNKKNPQTISLGKFKESLLMKEKYGHEAEEIVLKYEKDRLRNHPNAKKIKIISELDVCAGYDIISYESSTSENRIFIEVKSHSGNPSFYWSSNELDLAKAKGESYYIYLVNRDFINGKNYKPEIITNPYKNIYYSTKLWSKEVANWYFFKN